MPKQSKESIIAELEGRKIGYSEDMSYNELSELLKEAQAKDEPKKVEEPIDVSKAMCGLRTIQDHERRLILVERRLAAIDA